MADQVPTPVALGDGRVRLAWAGTAAERETAEIIRQASTQSAAIREAAEREAAALRAAVMEMSAGLGGVISVQPATKPRTRPGTGTKGRQVRAMRKAQVAFVALSLVGVTTGTAEIALHGFSFFLFRNAGAGAGNSRNLNEDQGPGQPDAPGAHHKAPRSISPRQVP